MEKLFFKNSAGLKLCGILEAPRPETREVVIFVHGYAANKNSDYSLELTLPLVKKGVNVFRIDLAGCGESEGNFAEQTISTMVEDTLAAVELMREKGFEKIDLFGTSAGALACMAAALKTKINKLALAAPVSDYPTQRRRKYGEAGLKEWKERGYNFYNSRLKGQVKVNYSFYEDSKNYVMYEKVSAIKCPVLIVHGDADQDVDLEDSQKLARNFPNAKLEIIKGADHILRVGKDRSKAVKIFTEWLAG